MKDIGLTIIAAMLCMLMLLCCIRLAIDIQDALKPDETEIVEVFVPYEVEVPVEVLIPVEITVPVYIEGEPNETEQTDNDIP